MLSMRIMSWTIADIEESCRSVYKKCPLSRMAVMWEPSQSPMLHIPEFSLTHWAPLWHWTSRWLMFYIYHNLEDNTSQLLSYSPYYLLHVKDASANQPLHPWPPDWVWSTGQLMFYVIPDLPEVSQCIDQICLSVHLFLSHCHPKIHPWHIDTTVWGIMTTPSNQL